MKGTMVCLFPSGREAHEEPALDLCAEAELRRTGVDSGSHENACLSPVGVQLTDTIPQDTHSRGPDAVALLQLA